MVVLVPFTGGLALLIGFIHGVGQARRAVGRLSAGSRETRSETWQQPVWRSSEQMVERTNAHDLEGMAALMHKDYQSEQPFHPARGFGGRAQMKANWGAILTGVPDLRAEVPASVQDGDVVWSEWHWWGTTEQGEPFELRAITQFTVRDGLVVSGRLFAELVEQGGADINDSVEAQSGHRPRLER